VLFRVHRLPAACAKPVLAWELMELTPDEPVVIRVAFTVYSQIVVARVFVCRYNSPASGLGDR
jgi:hypothetical protein